MIQAPNIRDFNYIKLTPKLRPDKTLLPDNIWQYSQQGSDEPANLRINIRDHHKI